MARVPNLTRAADADHARAPRAPHPEGPASARLAVVIPLLALAGFAYGWLTAHLPAPDDAQVFWLGNVAAPYVLLPAGAAVVVLRRAWVGRRPLAAAAAAGAATAAGMVLGFYDLLGVGAAADRSQMELDPSTPTARVVLEAYRRFFGTFVLGVPGGRPWLSIGLVAGAAAGLVAGLAVRRRSAALAGLLAAAPVAEAALYVVGGPYLGFARSPRNLAVWTVEAAAGVVLVVVATRRVRRTA